MGCSFPWTSKKLKAEMPCYICVIGGPGSGKTTQSKYILQLVGYEYISTGQILRQALVNHKLSNSENIKQRIKEGKPVDSDIIIKLLKDSIEKQREKHIVLDGFPINEQNFEAWNVNMKEKLNAIFYLEVTEDEMKRRLIKRNERNDDNESSIKERIKHFNYETKPLIEYLRDRGRITIFDGMKSKEELNKDIRAEIMKRKLFN